MAFDSAWMVYVFIGVAIVVVGWLVLVAGAFLIPFITSASLFAVQVVGLPFRIISGKGSQGIRSASSTAKQAIKFRKMKVK